MKTTKVTIHTLRQMKERGEKIAMLTAYDATFARLLDEGGADVLLVGDSLGMVVQGHETTLPVTLEDMAYHCRAVVRGTRRAHVVGDMPFMSYQASHEQGVTNAGKLMKDGSCHAVKIEGGAVHAELVHRLVNAGIPVMGHIGLTPQSYHQLGGFKVQGRDVGGRERLLSDARTLEEAGVYSIVLEAIPADIAREITASVSIPTIGIGAGTACDGQVLVSYDVLGMDETFKPRFVRRYETLGQRIKDAVGHYVADVRAGAFPSDAESFSVAENKATPTAMDSPYSSAGKK
ncbi:MAG: 3-methyl-2-oxobutanoate hydroxymethyltransferase [Deltaproteobacteria bacterium]|nr:3-methyl-2-oxobutanoate hydroxymethyltransferase [Deltaproteobacteria bacterium]